MARYLRRSVDSELIQVVSRFVNREFRIRSDVDREEYLRRAAIALKRCDCRILAFALMSNHIHLVLLGGRYPLSRLFRSLHSGFASYLNRAQGRLGPVFADRYQPYFYNDASALRVIAYVHNNPARAGIVDTANDSAWTSHRYYARGAEPPKWLDVALGLSLAGFEANQHEEFDRAVAELRGLTRDSFFGEDDLRVGRSAIRRAMRMPIELATSHQNERGIQLPIMALPGNHAAILPTAARVIELAREWVGVPHVMQGAKSHRASAVAARRLALMVWDYMGGSRTVMAHQLGVSDPAASMLVSLNRRAIRKLEAAVTDIVAQVTDETDRKNTFLKILKTVPR